jgi:hypothetical protein
MGGTAHRARGGDVIGGAGHGERDGAEVTGPQRRTTRQAHLNAHIVPVEQALIARAEALDTEARALMDDLGTPAQETGAGIRRIVAAEFRALAKELHWWS